jgi:hypothetical protein
MNYLIENGIFDNYKELFMKKIYVLLFWAAVLFSGCVSVDYVGQKLPERDAGEYIHIYPSMQEVPPEYKILGRGKVMTPQAYDLDKLDEILTEKAIEVGADAVAVSSQRRVAVDVDNGFQSKPTRPSGSWNSTGMDFEGDLIYTDSFGSQVALRTTPTTRYRIYYQVVFLTKTDINKKTVTSDSGKDDSADGNQKSSEVKNN